MRGGWGRTGGSGAASGAGAGAAISADVLVGPIRIELRFDDLHREATQSLAFPGNDSMLGRQGPSGMAVQP